MKKLIEFFNSKNLMFKEFEEIEKSHFKTKKNISIFCATSLDKKYWLILINHNKTKILHKDSMFFEEIYEKTKGLKEHNFAVKSLFCNVKFCSKALTELKQKEWKIYNDFV